MTPLYDAQTGIRGNTEDLQKLLVWFAEPQGKIFTEIVQGWMTDKYRSFRQCRDDDDRGRFRCQVECQALERVRDFPQKLREALDRKASTVPENSGVEG
jgi:hypothetical protein